MFGLTPFELRYDVSGRVAVRVAGGGVMDRHVEREASAPWVIEARCGAARGWLLAEVAPADPARVAAWLDAEVARRAALARERQATLLAALDAELLERLTHRLRTELMTLAAVAEGALEGLFEDDAADVAAELRRTSQEAQRRITAAREVMTTLERPHGAPEPIVTTLRAELEGAGRETTVKCVIDEEPWTAIGGAGWAACARLLAADDRLGEFMVAPDEHGWRVSAAIRWVAGEAGVAGRGEAPSGAGEAGVGGRGDAPSGAGDAAVAAPGDSPPAPGDSPPARGDSPPGPGDSSPTHAAAVAWSDRVLGDLARAGHIVVAAGGHATAYASGIELVLPAAVP